MRDALRILVGCHVREHDIPLSIGHVIQRSPLLVLLNGQLSPVCACNGDGLLRWAKENAAVVVREFHATKAPSNVLIDCRLFVSSLCLRWPELCAIGFRPRDSP